jgi:hypothetical protein
VVDPSLCGGFGLEMELSRLSLHCRYPEDRVPPRTSSKPRRKTRPARMHACPMAPAPASRLMGAPEPTRALWPRLPPLGSGQLRSRHVPHGSSSRHQAPGQLRDRHMPPGLQLPPPSSGQLRSCHVSRGRALWVVNY